MADKNEKLNAKPSKKMTGEEIANDPYIQSLVKKRAERLAKIREKYKDDPVPEKKEEPESREDYIKKTNQRYINMIRDKRIKKAKDRMKGDE